MKYCYPGIHKGEDQANKLNQDEPVLEMYSTFVDASLGIFRPQSAAGHLPDSTHDYESYRMLSTLLQYQPYVAH
jgi:hypothetical protein